MPTIYWAGDSTVQYNSIYTYPQTGLGQVMNLFLRPDVRIENHAKNGRSTKSFMDEGRLVPIEERIGEGDFLFIQFGHNDEKIADPTRYTDPFGQFQINLKTFVDVALGKNAYPVLITPLERRCFAEDGLLKAGEHGQYVAAMKQVAEQCHVALVDLYSMSRVKLTNAGMEETKKWYMHVPAGVYPHLMEGKVDNTHLKYEGAVVYASCIAQGLKALGGVYEDLLLQAQEE